MLFKIAAAPLNEWEKILLYAGNFSLSSPLLFIRLGKIYFISSYFASYFPFLPMKIATYSLKGGRLEVRKRSEQSAGNFTFSTKAAAHPATKNTYNSYLTLPKISEHVPKHKSNLTDLDFGY